MNNTWLKDINQDIRGEASLYDGIAIYYMVLDFRAIYTHNNRHFLAKLAKAKPRLIKWYKKLSTGLFEIVDNFLTRYQRESMPGVIKVQVLGKARYFGFT